MALSKQNHNRSHINDLTNILSFLSCVSTAQVQKILSEVLIKTISIRFTDLIFIITDIYYNLFYV